MIVTGLSLQMAYSTSIWENDITRVSGSPRMGDRQCTGIKKDGTRCNAAPIRGGAKCPLHGGGNKMAQQAARDRILALIEPATAALALAVKRCSFAQNEQGNIVCETHGADGCPEWPVRVSAAKALLDRGGFGPHAKLTIEDKQVHDLSSLDTQQIAEELEDISRQLRANVNVSDTDHNTGLMIIDTVAVSDDTHVHE